MGLFDGIAKGLIGRSQPLRSADDLGAFLDSRAAFLAQKCVVEFCRVRAGVYWQKLFSEAEFQRELTRSRWRAYPPAFAMLAEMAEGVLRAPAGVRRLRLPGALTALAERRFAAYPVPEGEADSFWSDAATLVRDALEATQAAPPRPVREIPKPLARNVFDALPFHKDIVTNDYDYIFNNLRMNLLRAHDDLAGSALLDEVADDLLGAR